MRPLLYLFAGAAVLGVTYLLLRMVVRTLLRFRGKMVVTCPETQQSAAVEVDAGHAALTSLLGQPRLQLQACSRWPARQDCGRECLKQIELSPEDCLVRTMLTRWYEGKSCAFCGREFGEINWFDHKPALATADGKTVAWPEVAAETLPETLSAHRPVCWNCHIAQKFRRDHPELVVEGPAKRGRTT